MPDIQVASGDVLAVVTRGWFGGLIRFFERLQGKPNISDHVVIVTRQDAAGRWIGIEGRPRGVGLVDVTNYLSDPRTRSNHNQPRDMSQLPAFLASAAKSLGIGYDWVGVAEDTLDTFQLHDLSARLDRIYSWPTDGLPGHVVCSSLAAWLYQSVGWASPGGGRLCEPADWWAWNDSRGWAQQSLRTP